MIELRSAAADDLEPLVDLTIRAFQDIQDGIRVQLGDALFEPQNGDWRGDYRRTLQELVAPESAGRTIVALADGRVAGFAAWTTHEGPKGPQGEISLIAVDPDYASRGIGTALCEFALQRMRDAGMKAATVATGGDQSHAPARLAYAKAGFDRVLPTQWMYREL